MGKESEVTTETAAEPRKLTVTGSHSGGGRELEVGGPGMRPWGLRGSLLHPLVGTLGILRAWSLNWVECIPIINNSY